MGHTNEEIEHAAERFETLADELDPATAEIENTEDLRAVAAASEATHADEVRPREAVEGPGRTDGRGTTSPSRWEYPGRPPVNGSPDQSDTFRKAILGSGYLTGGSIGRSSAGSLSSAVADRLSGTIPYPGNGEESATPMGGRLHPR